MRAPATVVGRNVALVSHCDFTGNSSLHVRSIALELHRRGFCPVILVPGDPRTVDDVGRPPFPVLSFRAAQRGRLRFPDDRGVDLVHAFTPRDHVHDLTSRLIARFGCPYIVHLEDNEQAIIGGRTQPQSARAFLAGAAGVTVVNERLLELKPDEVPGVVVWPGFDEAILSPRGPREAVRRRLGLDDEDLALVYTGNIHATNVEEMRALYLAVSQLRQGGHRTVLVRTGWDFVPRSALPRLDRGLRELGWVSRGLVPELLAAADVLVQPGRPNSYNDYRFPSKLPEFLASGRPVVLPRSNVGLHLRDGVEAVLLDRGDADEIAEEVAMLSSDPALREEIGAGGRSFALRELRWSKNVDHIVELYRHLEDREPLARAGSL